MEYIEQVTLDINGVLITDFKSVTIKEQELYKPVELMNTTGFSKVVSRHGVEVEYAIPKDEEPFDFSTVKNGRLSVDYGNGKRSTFTGVYPIKIGDTEFGGGDGATQNIEFGATGRIEE